MCTDHSREAPRSHSHAVRRLANGSEKPFSHGRPIRGRLLRALPPWSVTSVAMVHLSGTVRANEILKVHSSRRVRADEILKVHSSGRVRADEIHELDSSCGTPAVTDVNSSSYLLETEGASDKPLKRERR